MQHLKDQNWFAVGLEVIVVIVGIFLGLQAQQWYEDHQERQLEKEILAEILEDLSTTKADLTNDKELEKRFISSSKRLLDNLKQKAPYDEAIMDLTMSYPGLQFSPIITGYETLKAKGVDLVQNQKLRQEIIVTYDLRINQMVLEGREFEKFHNPQLDLEAYLSEHMQIDYNRQRELKSDVHDYEVAIYQLKLKDFETLANDVQFQLILLKTIQDRYRRITQAEMLLLDIEKLEELIKMELTEF